MAKRKRKDLKRLIIPKLRQLSRYWYEKRKARDAAKVKVQVGVFKNGNPKYEVKFRCESCQGVFLYNETQMDHKVPVVDVDVGWVSWDEYINRLFCPQENYQCLCIGCHEIKSTLEQEYRKEARKRKKDLDNEEN